MIEANIQKKIPAGIIDNNTEFFAVENKFKAFHRGEIIDFDNFPLEILSFIKNLYHKDFVAQKALKQWGFISKKEKLKRYGMCMFGGLDSVPDMIANGNFQQSEYWNCGQRGKCPFEGKICKPVKVKNGVISIREIQVVNILAEGEKDSVVAEKLGISKHTLSNHKQSINKKLGTKTKFNALFESIKLNLINYVW